MAEHAQISDTLLVKGLSLRKTALVLFSYQLGAAAGAG